MCSLKCWHEIKNKIRFHYKKERKIVFTARMSTKMESQTGNFEKSQGGTPTPIPQAASATEKMQVLTVETDAHKVAATPQSGSDLENVGQFAKENVKLLRIEMVNKGGVRCECEVAQVVKFTQLQKLAKSKLNVKKPKFFVLENGDTVRDGMTLPDDCKILYTYRVVPSKKVLVGMEKKSKEDANVSKPNVPKSALVTQNLRDQWTKGPRYRYSFFWGSGDFMSQWHSSEFTDPWYKNVQFYSCEQYMMYRKAVLFNDMAIAKMILKAFSPREQKALGQRVSGFNEAVWRSNRLQIVARGNFLKFSQNMVLREKLLATEDRVLVEASPRDRIWGIGLGSSQPEARDPRKWRGTNLLGISIMAARERISKSGPGFTCFFDETKYPLPKHLKTEN